MQLLETLKTTFGHDRFRPLQQQVVEGILAHKDALMVLPTGGGKSLCYQLPSIMMPGTTVVVSPLLALMHDQVSALNANGITSAMLSSMQSHDEIEEIEADLLAGQLKLLYVAPERFKNKRFLALLEQIPINFFVIDEAHCISQWGHEFREDYRNLSLLKTSFPKTSIAAFTATATDSVRDDIVKNLHLDQPIITQGQVFRENLHINVDYRMGNGRQQLLQFLQPYQDEAGIIYTLSRKSTEELATFLQSKGLAAKPYHAGLDSEERNQTYADFVADKISIVVATIAFGMGIDKSNIRYVVHMNMPKALESYYQEIGRAGRDGLAAETLLLYGNADVMQQKKFIQPLPEGSYKTQAFDRLNTMIRFANAEVCRHQVIAHYFNDTIAPCIDHCDNCVNPEAEKKDISEAAQKLLSAILRTNQRFGLHYVLAVLLGAKDKRVLANGHEKLTVYGIGKEYSKQQWLSIGDRLLELGYINFAGDYNVCYVNKVSRAVLKGEESVDIKLNRLQIRADVKKERGKEDFDYDKTAFEALRKLRKEIAAENHIAPYMVFSDRTLKELSAKQPTTKTSMLSIYGIGEAKFERYGGAFLALLREL